MDARRALENFIIDNRNLEALEDLLVDFNVFEVLGIEKSEKRHSAFLAWLLDPNGNHGLGDYFLRRFLWRVTSYARTHEMAAITAFDVDHWKLRNVNVETERHRVDILLTSEEDGFVCAIENKLFSGEHGNQLERYRHVIERDYSGLTPLFVFLTIEGEPPAKESDAAHYIPVSYLQIDELIQQVLDSRSTSFGANLQGTLVQYVTSLRRHVLADSDIQQLARQIYYDHKEAINLIIDAIPDVRQEIRDIIEAELQSYPGLEPDVSSKSFIRYCPNQWDGTSELREGKGWTETHRILLFEFRNLKTLSLHLVLGPGPDHIRNKLFDHAKVQKKIFNNTSRNLPAKWGSLYRKQILTAQDYEELDIEVMRAKVRQAVSQFVADDLEPLIHNVQAAF